MAPDSPNVAANPNVATDAECSEYYNNASHYDVLWGKDNIHIGFYPHLVSKTALHLDFQQAAVALTERMRTLGDITHSLVSSTLDAERASPALRLPSPPAQSASAST